MKRIIYIGEDRLVKSSLVSNGQYTVEQYPNVIGFETAIADEDVAMVLADYRLRGLNGVGIFEKYKEELQNRLIPFGIILNNTEKDIRKALLKAGVSEVYAPDTSGQLIFSRVSFLQKMLQSRLQKELSRDYPEYKIPMGKRIFDIVVAGLALIVTSPVLLLSAMAIRIESPGPIFYISKRVGTGYKVFDFYKLRTMYIDAEQRMAEIKHLNQYAQQVEDNLARDQVAEMQEGEDSNGVPSPTLIYKNGATMREEEYLRIKKQQQAGTFVKIKDDPRVTRVGAFLRNTSIDELPQLFNVLKGDMSIVGNRPLPLYEAEQLTSDDWGERFLAPAGITGLWQVMKRGKGEMSEEERKALDNRYARKVSLWNDIKLIFKTVPALFQKENV